VFFDGSDEFFEITNADITLFTGTLVVSGAKSALLTLQNVVLYPGQSRVYGDQVSYIIDRSVIAL
jgi:hypothetical protein